MKMNSKSESAINSPSQRLANPAHQPASFVPSPGDKPCSIDRKFAEVAYLRAGQYGFVPEDALPDWFQGEAEVKASPRRGQ
jgi:hypothetical protein